MRECACSRGTRGARMAAPQRVRGDSAGTGVAQPAGLRGSAQKRKGPPGRSAQGAASHGRPVLTGRNGESAAARRSGTHKNEEAPCRLGRGPVSDKRLVLASRGRESVAARRNGAKKKPPTRFTSWGARIQRRPTLPGPGARYHRRSEA